MSDYRWLVEPAASRYLERAVQHDGTLVTLLESLRKDLSPARAQMVAAQVELRRRAAAKFSLADRMFFTRIGLEQATGEQISAYKASRFVGRGRVVDLCCGLGGDLVTLADVTECGGVDIDPRSVVLASANCRAYGVEAEVAAADVTLWQTERGQTWHLDPDRRAKGRRVTRFEEYEPGPECIERLLLRSPDGAVKLAPATRLTIEFDGCEREWIGDRGECKQQVLWFGSLAHREETTATVIGPGGVNYQVSGAADVEVESVPRPRRFLYEPHATVLAARLQGALAAERELARLTATSAYLTGDQHLDEPLLASFEVLECLPLDIKRLRSLLRVRSVGQLELKSRGMAVDLDELRRRLRLKGPNKAVLLIAAQRGRSLAILARRVQRIEA